jgi:hypothetical protein
MFREQQTATAARLAAVLGCAMMSAADRWSPEVPLPKSAKERLTMAFIQSVEFATDRKDEMLALMRQWSADAIGKGTAQRATLAADRSTPGRFVTAVWFESAESAAENTERGETGAFAAEFAKLCTDGPTYSDYDVLEIYGG